MRTAIQSALTPRVAPRPVRKEASVASSATTSQLAATTVSTEAYDPAANFKALFGNVNKAALTPGPPAETPKPAAPTLQSVFGGSPYATNPGGMAPNGVTYGYNPTYFATKSAADKLAQMYGGTVVQMNAITPYGPFQQNQMNQMIRFSNGNIVNAGILASYFDRGWSQEQIDGAIAGEINQIPG
jgi:hypothetical protein